MMIDWGVQLMNFGTDVKRVAYVLKPGEVAPPKSIQSAFDKAISVRDVVKKAIKVGVRADETMKRMDAALQAAVPEHVRDARAAHVLVRILRRHADCGVGRVGASGAAVPHISRGRHYGPAPGIEGPVLGSCSQYCTQYSTDTWLVSAW